MVAAGLGRSKPKYSGLTRTLRLVEASAETLTREIDAKVKKPKKLAASKTLESKPKTEARLLRYPQPKRNVGKARKTRYLER